MCLMKPKVFIQWVADHAPSNSPMQVDKLWVFHRLFKSDLPLGDMADLEPKSLEIVKGVIIETGFWSLAKWSINLARKEVKARTEKALKEIEVSEGSDALHPTSEQLVGNECVWFQGLHVAYFALDKDTQVACLDEANKFDMHYGLLAPKQIVI